LVNVCLQNRHPFHKIHTAFTANVKTKRWGVDKFFSENSGLAHLNPRDGEKRHAAAEK
jgi:hypothetical protein